MDFDALLGLLVAALALMGGPGPATLSVAATAAVFGVSRAIPYYAGVCCGTSTIVLLVGTGVTGLVFAVPGVAPVLVVFAGAYILYLAYRIATAPALRSREEAGTPPPMLVGYLFAVANPKGYAAIGALFAGSALSRLFQSPQSARVLNITFAVLLVLSVVVLFV